MKILLVFTDIDSYHNDKYNFGLAYLSSFLKKNGHEVEFRYLSSEKEFGPFVNFVSDYSPELIGFTSVESQFIHVKELSRLIKQVTDAPIICGGPYASLFPEIVGEVDSLDGTIIGEGEIALSQLAENLNIEGDYRKSPNLCYYDKKEKK